MFDTKYHKTVIQVTVLSERPFVWEDLNDINDSITEGDSVGTVKEVLAEFLTPKAMADALYEAGSEPGFFRLDDNGVKLTEEEDF